jgi:hypothetical protein
LEDFEQAYKEHYKVDGYRPNLEEVKVSTTYITKNGDDATMPYSEHRTVVKKEPTTTLQWATSNKAPEGSTRLVRDELSDPTADSNKKAPPKKAVAKAE